MPELAKSYDFSNPHTSPTIDGQEFPYYVDIRGPLVEATEIGHVLWVPILVDAPIPTPPYRRPEGIMLADSARES